MPMDNIQKHTKQKMQGILDKFEDYLKKIRTGRAHSGMLDSIKADYYGKPTSIKDMASISISDSQTLSVQPYDKNMYFTIEKAIRESDLDLNPANQGGIIRIPIPPLTTERRKKIVKVVYSNGEEAKIHVRSARKEGNDAIKEKLKDKKCSEDQERDANEEIQKMTDQFVKKIDTLVANKEKEILPVV